MPDSSWSTARSVQLGAAGLESVEFEVLQATEGSSAANIGSLLSRTGLVTFDPGFVNTAACSSAITYIDGDAGILRYRGYPIEELAGTTSFAEVSHLLLHDHLPSAGELDRFTGRIREQGRLAFELAPLFDALPKGTHPMAALSAAVSALSAYCHDSVDPLDPDQVELTTYRLLAALPTIAGFAFLHSGGRPLPTDGASTGDAAGDLLRMVSGGDEPNPLVRQALDLLFVLHADHEQNCSTSAVRLVGSAQADLFASIVAGINALSGPLHGGANQAVLTMLESIRAEGGNVADFVERVKRKEQGVRLMGFGHRVYKNYDPRAAIVKRTADEILNALGKADDLLDLAYELEQRALSDSYFVERKLYPNVDFYTGLLYRAMGFPADMFTVLFAVGRLPGWLSHWREASADPQTKIARPRQLYVGPTQRGVERPAAG
jgi:citrate synthase